jgi:hypothetical protein
MIANAQEIFGPQDIASAQECACAEMGFSLRRSASKKIGPTDSLEGSRDAGTVAEEHPELSVIGQIIDDTKFWGRIFTSFLLI